VKKILFVHPHVIIDAFQFSKVDAPIYPSLTIAALTGVAKKAGYSVAVSDLYGINDPINQFKQDLLRYRPDLVGITFHTPQADQAAELSGICKKFDPSILVIGGGVHATAVPEETLQNSAFDFLVIGEGEISFAQILSGDPISNIPGIAYREGNQIRINPPHKLIDDLDSLPMPDYSPFDLPRYRIQKLLWKNPACINIETSRGCPYSCDFCVSNLVFGRRFRAKSPERVHEELKLLANIGFKELHIQDDDFTVDLTRAMKILDLMVTQGPRFDLELFNGVRTERLTPEFLRLGKAAGCYRMRIGIESGSRDVLQAVKKNIDLARVPSVIAAARSLGIEVIALFILGLPGETKENFLQTVKIAKSCGADLVRLSLFVPYPGSAIYKQWREEKRLLNVSYDKYIIHNLDTPLFNHPTMTHEQLRQSYKYFYRAFYFRPAYIIKQGVRWIKQGMFMRYARYSLDKFIFRPLINRFMIW